MRPGVALHFNPEYSGSLLQEEALFLLPTRRVGI